MSAAPEAGVTAPAVVVPAGTVVAGRRCPGCGVLDVIVTAGGRIVCQVCRWGRLIGHVIPTTCPDCRQTVVVPAAAFERCGRRPRRRRP